jgi:chromosome segregation ATPase
MFCGRFCNGRNPPIRNDVHIPTIRRLNQTVVAYSISTSTLPSIDTNPIITIDRDTIQKNCQKLTDDLARAKQRRTEENIINQDKLQFAENSIAKLNGVIKEYAVDFTNLQRDLNNNRSRLETANMKLFDARLKLSEKDTLEKALNIKYQYTLSERTLLNDQLTQLQYKITGKDNCIHEIKLENKRFEEKIKSLEEEINNLKKYTESTAIFETEQLKQHNETLGKRIALKEKEIELQKNGLKKLSYDYDRLENEKTEIDDAIKGLISSNTDKDGEIEKLKNEKTQLVGEIENLLSSDIKKKSKIAKKESKIAKLKQRLNSEGVNAASIELYQEQIKLIENRNNCLNLQIAVYEEELIYLRDDHNTEIEAYQNELRNKTSYIKTKIASDAELIDRYRGEIQELRQMSNDDLTAHAKEFNLVLGELQQLKNTQSSDNKFYEEERLQLTNQIKAGEHEYSTDVEELLEIINEKDISIKSLQSIIDSTKVDFVSNQQVLRSRLARYQRNYNIIHDKFISKDRELNESKKKCDAMREQINSETKNKQKIDDYINTHNLKIADLTAKMENLESELNEKNGFFSEVADRMADERDILEKTIKDNTNLTQEVSDLKREVELKNIEIEGLKKNIQEASDIIQYNTTLAKEKIKKIEKGNDDLMKQIANQNQLIDEKDLLYQTLLDQSKLIESNAKLLTQTNFELQSTINTLQSEYGNLQSDYDNRIAKLQEQIRQLSETDQLSEKHKNIKSRITSFFDKTEDQYKRRINELEQILHDERDKTSVEIEALKKKLNSDTQVGQLENSLKIYKTEIEKYKKNNDDLTQQLVNSNTKIQQLINDNKIAQQNQDKNEQRYSDTRNKQLEEYNKLLEEMELRDIEYDNKINESHEKLSKELETAKANLNQATLNAESLKQELNKALQENIILIGEKALFMERLSSLERENKEKERLIMSAEETIKSLNVNIVELRKDISELSQELSQLYAQNGDELTNVYKQEVDYLTKENESLKQQLLYQQSLEAENIIQLSSQEVKKSRITDHLSNKQHDTKHIPVKPTKSYELRKRFNDPKAPQQQVTSQKESTFRKAAPPRNADADSVGSSSPGLNLVPLKHSHVTAHFTLLTKGKGKGGTRKRKSYKSYKSKRSTRRSKQTKRKVRRFKSSRKTTKNKKSHY